jgi:hypothetical protein
MTHYYRVLSYQVTIATTNRPLDRHAVIPGGLRDQVLTIIENGTLGRVAEIAQQVRYPHQMQTMAFLGQMLRDGIASGLHRVVSARKTIFATPPR